jgi:hypothetical protein
MNQRERRLLMVLGVILLGGAAFAGYSLILGPIEELKAEAERVQDEIASKDAILTKLRADQVRVDAAKKRSLPANMDRARVEYGLMMHKLLRDAGAPVGFSVTPRDSLDTKSVPELDPKTKKPAYSKLGFVIRMTKVDLGTVMKFLHAYYRLNLLHQITQLTITRKEDTVGSRSRDDRNDLEVTIITEAIILDGAENRQTLLPMPLGAAMVGGTAGYHALLNTPEAGRGISPLQLANVLATTTPPRDYLSITARDFIHGPLPPPPTPREETIVQAPPPPPPPPKEDINAFIKLTGVTTRSDGSAVVDIFDFANKQDYTITLKPKGERYETKVEKFFFVKGARKRLDFWPDLIIQEEGTTTDRKFKVIGLDGLALVLTEATTLAGDTSAKTDGPAPKGGGGRFGPRTAPVRLPAPVPATAVLGGSAAVMAPSGEKVFLWHAGQSLKDLIAVPPEEVDQVLRRAAPPYSPAVSETPSAPLSKAD